MVNCCTGAAGFEQGAIIVCNFTGETGGGVTSEEFADNFMCSNLASASFSSVARFCRLAGMEPLALFSSS